MAGLNGKFKVCENCSKSYSYRLRKCPVSYCRGTVWRNPTCDEIAVDQAERDAFETILNRLLSEASA